MAPLTTVSGFIFLLNEILVNSPLLNTHTPVLYVLPGKQTMKARVSECSPVAKCTEAWRWVSFPLDRLSLSYTQ